MIKDEYARIDIKLDEIERFTRAVRHFSNEKIATVAGPHFHKLADQLIDLTKTGRSKDEVDTVNSINRLLKDANTKT